MKIKNRERLNRKLAALPKVARAEIIPALRKSADEITNAQQRFVPVEDGVLRGTIRNTIDETHLRATLTAGGPATTKSVVNGQDGSYDYALGQEFGTANMPANPFFFPGYRLGKKRVKSRITRAVNKAAKKVAAL